MAAVDSHAASSSPMASSPAAIDGLVPGTDEHYRQFFAPLPAGGCFADRFDGKQGMMLYSAAMAVYSQRTGTNIMEFRSLATL